MAVDVDALIRRAGQLKSDRGTFEQHWQEVSQFMLPRRADFNVTHAKGDKRNQLLYDGTALKALEMLAASLHGMLTSQATPWFQLGPPRREMMDQPGVPEWLEEAELIMYDVFGRSNFETEVHELYIDLAAIGTACMFVEEDDETVVRFGCRNIAEIFIAEDARGRADTVFRKYKQTARQFVQRFGEEKVGRRIQAAFKERPDTDIECLHVVQPRDDANLAKVTAKNFPFASIYIEPSTKHLIDESGFREFPYVVPRYSKASGEMYGRSPGMTALPDTKVVNKMGELLLKAAAKVIDPPLMAPDDGFLGPVKTVPGGVNYYRAGSTDRIEPLVSGANLPLGLELEKERREAIRAAFYSDYLMLRDGPAMTATEVLTRTEEKMRMLGPVLGRMQSEMLEPLIERVFAICFRRKMFPPAPPILAGTNLKVRYVSPMARAQRATSLQGIQRYIEITAPIAPAMPELIELFKPAELAHATADMLGVPDGVRRSVREMKTMTAQRQQEQQQAKSMATAGAVVDGAAKAAKATKDAGIDASQLLGLQPQGAKLIQGVRGG